MATIPSLADALRALPDFRQKQGQRHEWHALLLLVCVAMLCGCHSQSAIAQWAIEYPQWRTRLGFHRQHGPSQATLHRLFAGVDHSALERIITAWVEQVIAAHALPDDAVEVLAIDGKTLRGSAKGGAEEAHLLSALCTRLGVVVAQIAVAAKTNEITAMNELLPLLVLGERVVTSDAIFTQRTIAQTILDAKGDYIQIVKDNQPTLRADIATVFATPPVGETLASATSLDTHGTRLEHRRITTTTALVDYSDWPGAAQVIKIERRVTYKPTRTTQTEITYAITSLSPKRATPQQLLGLIRQHWHIENRLHYVRDVTCGEDRSTVRAAHIPQVMAAFRNAAISIMRLNDKTNIAAACRHYAAHPEHAFCALGLPYDNE